MKKDSILAKVLLGSAVTVAGLALYLYLDESARARVEALINREKVKYFVKHRLNAPAALVDAVDHLSDSDVNRLVRLSNEADAVKDSTHDALDNFIKQAKHATHQVTDKVSDMF